MLLVQIANIFNDLVNADPDINYFHFGFPNDVNINIANNYDPNAEVGRQFPYVLLLPPISTADVQQAGNRAVNETYNLEVIITDTYAYDGQQLDYKTDTSALVFSKLQVLAERLIKGLLLYSEEALPPFNIGQYRIEFDPYRFINGTRSIRMTVDLVFPIGCNNYNVDVAALLPTNPENVVTYDKEDPLNTTPI